MSPDLFRQIPKRHKTPEELQGIANDGIPFLLVLAMKNGDLDPDSSEARKLMTKACTVAGDFLHYQTIPLTPEESASRLGRTLAYQELTLNLTFGRSNVLECMRILENK